MNHLITKQKNYLSSSLESKWIIQSIDRKLYLSSISHWFFSISRGSAFFIQKGYLWASFTAEAGRILIYLQYSCLVCEITYGHNAFKTLDHISVFTFNFVKMFLPVKRLNEQLRYIIENFWWLLYWFLHIYWFRTFYLTAYIFLY